MKLWIDDIREAPKGYTWCQSVNKAKEAIINSENTIEEINKMFFPDWYMCMVRDQSRITVIDIDHDAGDYVSDGGDYIKLLDWLEATGRSYPIRIHSKNPVGIDNMRRIIRRNNWTEVI